jgi:hypothetical protein
MRRNLEPASHDLQKVVVNSLRRAPKTEAPLLAWPLVCGSRVAERTRALDFVEAVLRVEVPDQGWRTQLMALAPHYVAAMNRYSAQPVRRIEFVVAGSRSATATFSRSQS